MAKKIVKVDRAGDVRLWDRICGISMCRFDDAEARPNVPAPRSVNGWWAPTEILQALCDGGHVTREVEVEPVLEWKPLASWHQLFVDERLVGVVLAKYGFTVYDPAYTTIIETKFLELRGEGK